MTRNNDDALKSDTLPRHLADRSIVLVGIMGAGKTAVGKRLAATLGLTFIDADQEIETASGYTVSEIFERFGEPAFRDVERRVIRRLLEGPRIVLATGGGAFMDSETRTVIRGKGLSIWIRATLPLLLRRVAGRTHRPLLMSGDPGQILQGLMKLRHPIYAEADIVIDSRDETVDAMAGRMAETVMDHLPALSVPVELAAGGYEVIIGSSLITRAGGLLGAVLPQRRAVVVTDKTVAGLHLQTLLTGLETAGFTTGTIIVEPGEPSKSVENWASVIDQLLDQAVERRTAVIALGGGVVGDLAGFAAAATMRGLPFVQVPTTLLSQVDSSVGGKTGINTRQGKNLIGAFYQPRMVLADTDTLSTLPPRELRAGYAEIVKTGLIGDAAFYEWCEQNGLGVVSGNRALQAKAIQVACAFKAGVVGDDEREEKPNDGRALLNLGHTFGHALEAEVGYGAGLLHGEAVAIGLGLAFDLSAKLGHCSPDLAPRIRRHLDSVGLPSEIAMLNRRFSVEHLVGHMRRDKKMRDGALHFVLARGIGRAFTSRDVPPETVVELLREAGCEA
ncbi:3-dehydroquinate synthase [Acidisoma cellulosilytica]|uniref:Multifunctional fusion protein n=2 Tax=Acidisoma cellulosilyticum TaxID=2802395 RepID=A0A963Z2V0_9PROT|nr:3-dehydroquinate synthase [Acidisoma cellulosilyticum]